MDAPRTEFRSGMLSRFIALAPEASRRVMAAVREADEEWASAPKIAKDFYATKYLRAFAEALEAEELLER